MKAGSSKRAQRLLRFEVHLPFGWFEMQAPSETRARAYLRKHLEATTGIPRAASMVKRVLQVTRKRPVGKGVRFIDLNRLRRLADNQLRQLAWRKRRRAEARERLEERGRRSIQRRDISRELRRMEREENREERVALQARVFTGRQYV